MDMMEKAMSQPCPLVTPGFDARPNGRIDGQPALLSSGAVEALREHDRLRHSATSTQQARTKKPAVPTRGWT
jgi:hypothetical protein